MEAELLSMDAANGSGMHIGCSGWVYRHWKDSFYPGGLPQKRWFEHYAAHFDTVEINASFYRLPLPSTFDGWLAKAPAGFRYAVKVNRFITHNKKLLDCAEPLTEFIALARRMGPALGPLLYQLPPSLHRNDDRLADFLDLLPPDLEHVFEFRHSSWYAEEVLALLDRHGIGFVAHDLAGLRARAGPAGEPLTSASTAPAANIGAVTRTSR
jgi:uncharacterized protein YecE (DUF72 family)